MISESSEARRSYSSWADFSSRRRVSASSLPLTKIRTAASTRFGNPYFASAAPSSVAAASATVQPAGALSLALDGSSKAAA